MEHYASYSDKQLFALIADGDENAFATIYYKYVSYLYSYVLGFTKSQSAAQEIIQDSLLRVWLNRDKMPEIDSPKNWIFRIAANECNNFLRREGLKTKVLHEVTSREAQRPESSEITFREINGVIQKAVNNLSPQRKLVYQLNRVQGLKTKEIAEQLGLAHDTVKKHLQIALQQIREELTKQGYAPIVLLIWGLV